MEIDVSKKRISAKETQCNPKLTRTTSV